MSKIKYVSDADIADYVSHIMDNMDNETLTDLEQVPHLYAKVIEDKIKALLKEHEKEKFRLWREQGEILCKPFYSMKESISPLKSVLHFPKTLYEEEDRGGGLNDYEEDFLWKFTGLENLRWWHRNIPKTEFCINGADFIARLSSGHILMIETKGDVYDNDDSREKAKTGFEWANAAGEQYRYFMVFETKAPDFQGAYSMNKFMEIVRGLR